MILSQIPPQNFQQLGGPGTIPRNQVFQQPSFTNPTLLSGQDQDLTRTTMNLPYRQQSYQLSSQPLGQFPYQQTQSNFQSSQQIQALQNPFYPSTSQNQQSYLNKPSSYHRQTPQLTDSSNPNQYYDLVPQQRFISPETKPIFSSNNIPSSILREQQQIFPLVNTSASAMQFNTDNDFRQPQISKTTSTLTATFPPNTQNNFPINNDLLTQEQPYFIEKSQNKTSFTLPNRRFQSQYLSPQPPNSYSQSPLSQVVSSPPDNQLPNDVYPYSKINRNQLQNQSSLYSKPRRFSPLQAYSKQMELNSPSSYDNRPTYIERKSVERVNTSGNTSLQSTILDKPFLSPLDFREISPMEMSFPYLQNSQTFPEISRSFVQPLNTTQNQDAINEQEDLKQRNINFLLKRQGKDFLKDYLRTIVDMERNIENNRIKIVREEDYSVQLFYELFDKNESGQLTISEIITGLKKLGIDADISDVKLLVSRYSQNNQNSILYQQEFINMVVPRTCKNISSIFVRKPYISEANMKENTRQLMGKIMKSLLNAEVVLEQMRVAIEESKIELQQLYFQISEDSTEPVNKQTLREYLINQGIFVNREEINLTYQRFDLNDMGFFREQEFRNEIYPRKF